MRGSATCGAATSWSNGTWWASAIGSSNSKLGRRSPASSLDRVLFEIPVDSDSAVSVTFLCVRMRLRRAPICEMAASMCGPLTFMVPSLTAIPRNGNISC